MNAYEHQQAARRERFEKSAERLTEQSAAVYPEAHRMADAIPFCQPILIGHHFESRDRN